MDTAKQSIIKEFEEEEEVLQRVCTQELEERTEAPSLAGYNQTAGIASHVFSSAITDHSGW